jgi:hypothetical protein
LFSKTFIDFLLLFLNFFFKNFTDFFYPFLFSNKLVSHRTSNDGEKDKIKKKARRSKGFLQFLSFCLEGCGNDIKIRLSRPEASLYVEENVDNDGNFLFKDITPGTYALTLEYEKFCWKEKSKTVNHCQYFKCFSFFYEFV